MEKPVFQLEEASVDFAAMFFQFARMSFQEESMVFQKDDIVVLVARHAVHFADAFLKEKKRAGKLEEMSGNMDGQSVFYALPNEEHVFQMERPYVLLED